MTLFNSAHSAADPYNLDRFIQAQAHSYDQALRELQRGHKTSHWMWYIFPQLRELGYSQTAKYYGLSDLAEAQAYWRHPILGVRLWDCTRAILAVRGKSAREILGQPDDLKLRSCMTLLAQVQTQEASPVPDFQAVLDLFYTGKPDLRTLELLEK